MKKALVGGLSLVLVAALTGCGSPTSEENGEEVSRAERSIEREDEAIAITEGSATVAPPAEAEAETEEMAEEAAAPAEAEPAVLAAEPAEEAPAPGATDGLTGTKWTHNEITLEFMEDSKVKLTGGLLATVAPDGYVATYTLDDGKISVDVVGEVHTGTWDGTKLIVDGSEAVKVE